MGNATLGSCCPPFWRYLHVRSAYAEAGASTDDRLLAHSEILLQKIFAEAASLGDQPVVISLDANVSRERSDTLNALFTSGRLIDVASEVAADRDQLQVTYHKDGQRRLAPHGLT